MHSEQEVLAASAAIGRRKWLKAQRSNVTRATMGYEGLTDLGHVAQALGADGAAAARLREWLLSVIDGEIHMVERDLEQRGVVIESATAECG